MLQDAFTAGLCSDPLEQVAAFSKPAERLKVKDESTRKNGDKKGQKERKMGERKMEVED